MTVIMLVVCSACVAFWCYNRQWLEAGVLGAVFAAMLISALFYAPVSVTLTDSDLIIRRPLKSRVIPIFEIASVRMCPPTMGEYRACGSGGFFGYWGRFGDGDTGRYFAYYGRASDCFLVTLRDGRKYMIGCREGKEMEEALAAKL